MCIVRHFWPADIGLAKTFFLSVIPRLGQSNDVIFFFTLLATHDFSFRLVYVSTYYSIKVQGFVRKKNVSTTWLFYVCRC